MCVYVSVCVCLCALTNISIFRLCWRSTASLSIYIHIYIYTYKCMYVCMYVNTYTYIHIYIYNIYYTCASHTMFSGASGGSRRLAAPVRQAALHDAALRDGRGRAAQGHCRNAGSRRASQLARIRFTSDDSFLYMFVCIYTNRCRPS